MFLGVVLALPYLWIFAKASTICRVLSENQVDCSNLGLSTTPSGIFGPLTRSVDLSGNSLTLPDLSLLPRGLVSLNLSRNGVLKGLGDFGFGFPALRILDLSHNNLSSLRDLSFKLYPALTTLDLSWNRILYLTPGGFEPLQSLESLNLRSNGLVEVQKGSLAGLDALKYLFLHKNSLVSLPKGLFIHSVPRLQTLDLSRNKFEKIEGLSFHGLTNLQVLKLRKNFVEYLSDGAFFGLEKIRHLYLDKNGINSVEKGWLYGLRTLETLSLSHNRIDYIAEEAWEFLEVLKELNLKSNAIQLLESNSFRTLPSLMELYLQDNLISHIDDGVFTEVPQVRVLALDGNALSHTIEDSNSPFKGLSKLKRLTLSRNMIKSIGEFAFAGGLESIEEIDLRFNVISTLHEKSLKQLKRLQILRIDSGSFLCDCYLRWLLDFVQILQISGLGEAHCAHPVRLKSLKVLSIPKESFTCEDFPKPYILQEPLTQITLKNHNLTLFCRAASTSPAVMTFQWKLNSEVIDVLDCKTGSSLKACVRNQTHSFDGKGREITSELRLTNLTYDDAGRYQCIVTNEYGATYSDRANITVYVFPSFLVTPEDVIAEGGMSVSLRCAAEGVPAPELSWKKDYGVDFPAASERRIERAHNIVSPSSSSLEEDPSQSHISVNSLIIHRIKAVDMGTYICTAKNPAGKISWNATLSVLETPAFVEPMEDKVSRIGETAIIDCSAKGSPKPILSWKKDGEDFVPTERHFFAANNQLLIIVKITQKDAGKYECTIRNKLGSATQSSELKVQSGVVIAEGKDGRTSGNSTTAIIVIAVLCCVIGTSLVWVIIIYKVRKYRTHNGGRRAQSYDEDLRLRAGNRMSQEDFRFSPSKNLIPLRNESLGTSSSLNGSRHSFGRSSAVASLSRPSKRGIDEIEFEKDSGTGDSKKSSENVRNEEEPAPEYINLPLLRPIIENNRAIEDSDVILRPQGGGESVASLSDFDLTNIPFVDDSSVEDEESTHSTDLVRLRKSYDEEEEYGDDMISDSVTLGLMSTKKASGKKDSPPFTLNTFCPRVESPQQNYLPILDPLSRDDIVADPEVGFRSGTLSQDASSPHYSSSYAFKKTKAPEGERCNVPHLTKEHFT